ncbi:unnamed protein product [Paramecium pentaurelia]|uniref:DNA/RNA-binding protein Alba-like domain-containing protein n=1 Tax=Paramecium pentaurelia TaxID=43138 RepID=A0A8S1XIP8_9CILI|nr:unnamed protein product [Paramecium pentaurelia]
MDQSKKTLVNPETNVYNLSGKTLPKTSVFVTKIYLKRFDVVEVHALGETISKAVRMAEQLQRQNYVTIEKINTFTQKFDDDRSKAKIVITLKVTADGKKRVIEEIKQ